MFVVHRLDQIEHKTETILSDMESIESRITDILHLNDILNISVQLDPELYGAVSEVQDELESEFNALVSLFDTLEAELNTLGDEYDSLVFVASLALPA